MRARGPRERSSSARGTRTSQDLRRRRGAGRRGLHRPRRLGAGAAGGERGREVEACEERGRRRPARRPLTADRGGRGPTAKPVQFANTAEAARNGVAVVSQELNLFGDLDVLANLFTLREIKHGPFISRAEMAR